MSNFWNFFNQGTPQSMTRLITFSLIGVSVIMCLFSCYLMVVGKFDLGFGGFIISIIGAALTGKVQGAKVEKLQKPNA